jgi:hypothetical protein
MSTSGEIINIEQRIAEAEAFISSAPHDTATIPDFDPEEIERAMENHSSIKLLLTKIKEKIFRENVDYVPFSLFEKGGRRWGSSDGPQYVLTKHGAETLFRIFKLQNTLTVAVDSLEKNHINAKVMCRISYKNMPLCEGLGCACSKERKYRYAEECPENIYNTILKMAKKRAFVDAVLTATGASDLFTQDLDDELYNIGAVNKGAGKTPAKFPVSRGYEVKSAPQATQGNVKSPKPDINVLTLPEVLSSNISETLNYSDIRSLFLRFNGYDKSLEGTFGSFITTIIQRNNHKIDPLGVVRKIFLDGSTHDRFKGQFSTYLEAYQETKNSATGGSSPSSGSNGASYHEIDELPPEPPPVPF